MPTEQQVCKLIVDVAVVSGGQVLFVRYSDPSERDQQSGWGLPDDLLRSFEQPEAAARRILESQLGIQPDHLRLGQVESFRGNDRSWHLAFHFLAEVSEFEPITPSAVIRAAEWFKFDALPPRAEVAHRGWALSVVKTLTTAPI